MTTCYKTGKVLQQAKYCFFEPALPGMWFLEMFVYHHSYSWLSNARWWFIVYKQLWVANSWYSNCIVDILCGMLRKGYLTIESIVKLLY